MRLRASVVGRAAIAVLLATAPVGTPTAYASNRADLNPADLAIRISGERSRGVPGEQVVTTTVTNRGPGTANGVTLHFTGRVDSEAVDPETLRFCAAPESSAPPPRPALAPSLTAEIHGSCALPDLAPGRSHGLRSVVRGPANPFGAIGEVRVEVAHAGADPAPADNSAATRLGFPGSGPHRLYARSWDGPADQAGRVGAVPPGGVGDLRFEIGNSGQAPVNGFTLTIELPHRVAFAERRPGCAYARNRRSATCVYGDLPIVPAGADRDPDDRRYSALRFRHGFAVDGAAPPHARLGEGLLRVEPMITGYLPPPLTRLPDDVIGLRAQDFDTEDDRDGFVVVTGAAAGDGAGLGDSLSSDGLPVTGTPIGMLGAAGLGLAVVGVALLLIARGRTGRSSR